MIILLSKFQILDYLAKLNKASSLSDVALQDMLLQKFSIVKGMIRNVICLALGFYFIRFLLEKNYLKEQLLKK